MDNNLNFENKQIFGVCREYCANCTKCVKNNDIFAKKYANQSNYFQDLTIDNDDSRCKTHQLLCDIAKLNHISCSTQFCRVEFFHNAKEYLNENCICQFKKNYNMRYKREWAQVLLYTYKAIPNICRMIEDIVDERALTRALGPGVNCYNENTFDQFENIINLLDRKTHLINLHIRTDRAVKKLPEKLLETAKIRFFERKNVADMSKKLNISVRTCQRRTEQLLDEFYDLMKSYGLDCEEILFDVGKHEPWLLEWFKLDMRTV